jgi:hypothetical protein
MKRMRKIFVSDSFLMKYGSWKMLIIWMKLLSVSREKASPKTVVEEGERL